MKNFFRLKAILISASICLFIGLVFFLFIEVFYNANFRSTEDWIETTENIQLAGLRELHASGGTYIRFPDLKRKLSHFEGRKIIVDGISEFHGYVNGTPTPFLAYHNSHPHWKYYVRRLVFTGTTEIRPDLVIPEAEEAKQNGFSYINVRIGSKFISSDAAIDEFIAVIDSLPQNAWIHFHCHYGKGRTSMMLVMYDIMKNAPLVSLQDIVKRQHLLGSENLLMTSVWRKGSYTKEQLQERKDFITRFYNFISQRKAGGTQRWSEWKQQEKPNM
ncbi:MAG: hypothetical protein K2P93_00865 [Alphaproteobacteria bacterium]|nr:hypothetical protein [Alphaproteobacteria bacterium]